MEQPSFRKLVAVAPFWTVWLLFNASRDMLTPFLGLYAVSAGATVVLVGYIYSVDRVFGLMFRLPMAAIADSYGERQFVLGGLFLNGLAISLYTLVHDPYLVLIGRALQGIALGTLMPAMLSLVIRTAGRLRDREFVAYSLTGTAVGQSIGPALGSSVLSNSTFFYLFLSSTIVAFLAFFVAFGLEGEKRQGKGHAGSSLDMLKVKQIKRILSRSFCITMFSRAAISYAMITIVGFVPLLAIRALAFSDAAVGWLFVLAAVLNIVARPLAGRLALEKGEKNILQYGCGLTAIACVLCALPFSQAVIWVAMVFYGLGYGLFIPPSITYVGKNVSEENRALGMALLTQMVDVGAALGGVASGFLLALSNYTLVFAVSAIVGLSGTIAQRFSD